LYAPFIKSAYQQISADICNICRYLQISADICRYLQISADICRYLVTPADIWSRQQISSRDMIAADRRNGKGVYRFSFLFCEKQNCK
jgi:hypothetical protein